MLPLIEKFVGALEAEGVVYCHWKSNAFISDAARGEDDLDLLVSHSSRPIFSAILDRFGFKEALKPKEKSRIPGILSYYGYDGTAPRLIHVHVHYKLILGHDLTKNYHLPVENAYLESSSQGRFFRLPAAEFEFVVFIIRMMLKHSTWSAILNGQGKLSARERHEMEYLQANVTRGRIAGVLTEHLPFLDLALFDDLVRSLNPPCPLWARFRAGQKIQKTLRGCALRPKSLDIWLQFWRRLAMAVRRRVSGTVPKRRLKSGGILAALVGGDGAGKTTVIKGISEWLSPRFAMVGVHLGKPSWSRTTILTRGILKIGRILGFYAFTRVPVEFRDAENAASFPGYPTAIRAVCTARDRYLSYRKARRQADKGAIVICDRFPLPRTVTMDGPQVEWMTRTLPRKRFIRLLGRLETKYYRSIFPPDLLFVLRANPNTAVERKWDENAAAVRARSGEIWGKDWEERKGVFIIDANQPKEEVLRRIKGLLWENL